MTDIASLQIKIDSTQTKEAVDNLNMLGTASKSAEGSVNSAGKTWVRASSAAGQLRMAEAGAAKAATDMATATAGAGTAAARMARDAQQSAAGLGRVAGQSKLAAHHMTNLSFQLQDIIIGLQGGQRPMTVFLQQGSQIGQIAMQAGVGIGAMGAAVVRMAASFLAAHPILLAVTIAGAAVAGVMKMVTSEINKTSDVTVTWQDTMLGAFDVVRDAVTGKVVAAFDAMGISIGDAWDFAVKATRTAVNFIIGATLAIPRAIAATYDKIGPAFGDAFYRAANLAIGALNKLAQMSAAPLNAIIGALNSAFGTSIPKVMIDGIEKLENPYAGAMGRLGSAAAGSLVKSFTTDYVGGLAQSLSEAAQNRARSREAAEKMGSKIGKAAGAAAGKAAADTATDEFLEFTIRAAKEVDKMAAAFMKDGQTLEDILKRIAREKDAAFKAMEADAAAVNDRLREMASLLQQIGGLGGLIGNALSFLNGDYGSIGGSLGRLFSTQFTGKDGTVKVLGDELKSIFGLNGAFGQTLSKVLGNAGAGAAIGDTADKFMKMLGIKSSNTGAQLGGAAGGAVFGPIGAIAGSILGGLVGGLFKKTKWGRVSVSGSGVGATEGNKGAFEDAALQAGNGVIDALNQIAEQLGGTLGTFNNIAIGVRDGKWRVNTTGTSLKTGNGAIDFGEDGQAAVAYAVSQAIKMGAIDGLRATTATLLQASGDFQEQLQKALTLESVFAEIERQADPMKYELDQLAQKFAQINQILAEGNATAAEYQQVADYQATLEQQIRDQYAADAAAAAEQARQEALARANEKLALEARLLVAQGDALGALAKQRQIELSQIDAANRALLQEVFAAEDLASAKQNLADAYARETRELQQTIDRMAGFSASLRDVRDNIFAGSGNGQTYNQALAKLMQVGGLAGAGDETALGSLGGAVNDFLGIAKSRAGSSIDFQRAQALAAGYLDKAIGFTDSAGNIAQRQLDEMKTQVSALVDINESVMTVAEAINRLVELQGGGAADGGGSSQSAAERARARMAERIAAMEERMAELAEGGRVQIRLQERLQRFFEQLSPDGLGIRIRTDADSPIDVTVSA